MSYIEAIIVDGVRYDRVTAKTEFVCEECELREVCKEDTGIVLKCMSRAIDCECWKRKE